MQFLNSNGNLDNNDLTLERPIGWSSACLDFTIDYYLNCNVNDLTEEQEKEQDLQNN